MDILDVMKQYEKAYKCFEFMGPTPIDFDTKMENFAAFLNEIEFDFVQSCNEKPLIPTKREIISKNKNPIIKNLHSNLVRFINSPLNLKNL